MIDTEGILDRCSDCGARAHRPRAKLIGGWGVECSECANCITNARSRCEAMTKWNKAQRAALNEKDERETKKQANSTLYVNDEMG